MILIKVAERMLNVEAVEVMGRQGVVKVAA